MEDLTFLMWKGSLKIKSASFDKFTTLSMDGWTGIAFTGCKDKHGFDVYDHDIVEDQHGNMFEVEFDTDTMDFALKGDDLLCNVEMEKFTRIGNRKKDGLPEPESILDGVR